MAEHAGVERDLKRAERFQAFIEHCSEGFWCMEFAEPIPTGLDPDTFVDLIYARGRMVDANRGMAQMYGLDSPEALLGARVEDLLPRIPPNIDYIRSFLAANYHLTDVESEERDSQGKTKFFLNNLRGIIEGGALVRIWGTQRDITAPKQLEVQLRQVQKMDAVGRLAGGVAHDFNNILSVILTYASLLEADPGATGDLREGLQQIRAAAERGAGLTRPLLAFSRQHVVAIRRLDVNQVVHGLEKMLDRLLGEDVEIATRLAADLQPIRSDAGAIEQILVNLVVNARDAMPEGGRLTIETANVLLDESYASVHFGSTPGRHVMLSVSDTGAGMDPITQSRIFEPFFTTKEVGKGTGLGLSIVYGLVKQNRGNVFVYSEPGHGTSIKIYLPQDAAPTEAALAAPAPVPPAPSCTGDEVVLLVDDDPLVRGAARSILDRFGYTVIEADNGERALTLGTADRPIHLLLTDVVMPRLSGRDLATRVRAAHPDLRVLFMSGYTEDVALRYGVLEGEVAYLQKPFTPDSLARMVRAVLDSPAGP